jgi:KUP system potassium uptake protein
MNGTPESSAPTETVVEETAAGEEAGGAGTHPHPARMGALALGALGIVYGDIGTSPLYAFRESFEHHHLDTHNPVNALGVASVVFWSLIIIISIKYLLLVMRADNRGEGGILALTAMIMPRGKMTRRAAVVVTLGVFGTALLYGDGLITPAISVLSAVEGLERVSTAFEDWVIVMAAAILFVLFLVQRRGTGGIGRVFGPVMVLWFTVLGILGLNQIRHMPSVFKAISPTYALDWFRFDPGNAFLTMGSIFLVVTGGEALYADMGHFGRRPIQLTWYGLVLPALLLNYLGQAAMLLREPDVEMDSLFFEMAPEWALAPLVVLATMAAVIASQALISGAFSLTVQAVQLDYLPRVKISHTSSSHRGQVYVPLVNWALMVGCIGLVLTFRTSGNLAAAYGIAVTTTMAITTLLFYVLCVYRWGWSRPKALAVCIPILIVDLTFLGANIPKIPHGGWFPLLIALGLVIQMSTWRRGRELVARRIQRGERPIAEVLAQFGNVARVPGSAVFMFKDLGRAPPALVNNLRHNKVLHRTTLIVSVATADVPRYDGPRHEVTRVQPGVYQVLLTFGFMEEPDVLEALRAMRIRGADFDVESATFFIGHESIIAGKVPGMHPLREQLFVVLNRGADSASRFFNLPNDRIFEVGSQVEI